MTYLRDVRFTVGDCCVMPKPFKAEPREVVEFATRSDLPNNAQYSLQLALLSGPRWGYLSFSQVILCTILSLLVFQHCPILNIYIVDLSSLRFFSPRSLVSVRGSLSSSSCTQYIRPSFPLPSIFNGLAFGPYSALVWFSNLVV